jgi:hypothetical protein
MNFGSPIFKNSIKRIVDNHSDFAFFDVKNRVFACTGA